MNPFSRSAVLGLAGLGLGLAVSSGAVLYVSPQGRAGASGGEEDPLRSVQEGLDRAGAGDVVHLRPGVYQERVVFRKGGGYGKPVVLEGEPGAVLDGSYPIALDWKPAPDVAPDVYRLQMDRVAFSVTAGGRAVAMLRAVRSDGREHDPGWDWRSLLTNGVPDNGWKGTGALCVYLPKEKQLLVRFADNADPRTVAMTVGPDKDQPVVTISGVNRCVVRGLAIRNAASGVLISDSVGSVVENCVIGPIDWDVLLWKGADRATIRFNEMFWKPMGAIYPKDDDSWAFWMVNKDKAGWLDRRGVEIKESVGGHRIHDNYIHDAWDGVSALPVDKGFDRDLDVHHNYVYNLIDDGSETAGPQENCQWHDNVYERCEVGIRLKSPDYGPLYVYRNLFFDNLEDIRNFGQKKDLLPCEAYIYQNTTTNAKATISNKIQGIGTPNYHYFNNFAWCEHWFENPKSAPSVDPNWQGDFNVYVRRGHDPRWESDQKLAARQGIDPRATWVEGDPGFADAASHDLSLKADSPARGKGTDLPKFFGKPLPACEPNSSGTAPDAGALQFGEPMPVLPRSPQEVGAPEAGSWPGPEADAAAKGPR